MKEKIRFDTRFGTGWTVWQESQLIETVLPGGPEPAAPETEDPDRIQMRTSEHLRSYFEGTAPLGIHPGLAARAKSGFAEHVYRRVAEIPEGETMSYAEVAAAVGRPGAARAVGAAMAANPFAPLIPCHRVVGSDGRLHGYGGGLPMKEALLEMERFRDR